MVTTDKYIFFWDGIYSNWFQCYFLVDNIKFNCSEQYFMYHKALHFGDTSTAEEILKTEHPKKQKQLGRKVAGYNEAEWEKVRYDIMKKAVFEKFRQNDFLFDAIISTGDKQFVEASPYDTVWGIGMEETEAGIGNEQNWKGQNLLGKVLCEVRDELFAN